MPNLDQHLKIPRCPHCSIDNPNLIIAIGEFQTKADDESNSRNWRAYKCIRCGWVVTASCGTHSREIKEIYPNIATVDENLPLKVKTYLQQAIDSTFAPSGSVMLCASSVDAMLKEKNLIDGALYTRINQAVKEQLLTLEMATWAHEVRLDANDQRHSDTESNLPTVDDAKRAIEFTQTLAEFLFILPLKIKRGIEASKK